MDIQNFKIPNDLTVVPLGEIGEMEILPSLNKCKLNTAKLPCGLPPTLPNTEDMLNSFLEHPEKLPILHLNSVQKMIPVQPNISSLYSINLCPLQTHLDVRRDRMTGKLLGFSEVVKDASEGTHKTSSSLSRAPGPPDAGIKGSSSSFPFWPGGMDEEIQELLKKETINTSLFEGDLLDIPPGFKHGMNFDRKIQNQVDYIHSQPQKIYLSDILSMEDIIDLEFINESKNQDLELVKLDEVKFEAIKEYTTEEEDAFLKIASQPVLKICDTTEHKEILPYEWAVIDDVRNPVEDFNAKIPEMAKKWTFKLDPFQQKAVLHLEKKESVFVAAHTSAGKTVVAEYAIALSKKHVSRVIYTSPIKALSNQKYRDFKQVFEDVGLITGDVQLNPTAFCLIMTTEILRSMLYRGSDVIRELEWVIFDEVHYINDLERGVVWEEVFIMLPDHIGLIMLSATVPNTAEFAEWLGRIKKRKIYVISTLKRPVPLEHFLYTGSEGQKKEHLFKIVDAGGSFLNSGYSNACNSKLRKKEITDKNEKANTKKGAHHNVKDKEMYKKHNIGLPQEKNFYINLLNHLKNNKLLPAVCFTFSRKKCNIHCEILSSVDLTDKNEKHKIKQIFDNSIKKLKLEDQKLPQVKLMQNQLERGFGVHHSGILPILKEVVEILFQQRLLKVLFATETFAMGVNMPARTVLFDSIRKHDGLTFRDLQPSEYIQMAGRAGRRGEDDTGTVIILCKAEVPDSYSLNNMMRGKPQKLESQFKLTYGMILNLLKIKTFRVEDVIKRSFGEADNQKECKTIQASLNETSKQLTATSKFDCSLCCVDLAQYIRDIMEAKELRHKIMHKKCQQAKSGKLFNPGRILVISTNEHQNILSILLSIDNQENKCKVLAITEKDHPSKCSLPDSVLFPWTKKLFNPNNKVPEFLTIDFKNIQVIGNKLMKIDVSEILKESKRMQSMANGSVNPGHSISASFQELCDLCERNINGFPSANINITDINFAEDICRLQKIEDSFQSYTCDKCPAFNKHFSEMHEYIKLEEIIKGYENKLSEESCSFYHEYKKRKQVLKSLKYIDESETVQLKGSVAREMSNHELLITELLVKSTFSDCGPEEVAALLSCMVFQQKSSDDKVDMPKHLEQKVDEIKMVAKEISDIQYDCEINEPDFVDQYNFQLVNVVYEWAKGVKFADIMENTEVDEGIIVRSIQRLKELLSDVQSGATLVGDSVLKCKMEEAIRLIKRDIVFAASLYTSDDFKIVPE